MLHDSDVWECEWVCVCMYVCWEGRGGWCNLTFKFQGYLVPVLSLTPSASSEIVLIYPSNSSLPAVPRGQTAFRESPAGSTHTLFLTSKYQVIKLIWLWLQILEDRGFSWGSLLLLFPFISHSRSSSYFVVWSYRCSTDLSKITCPFLVCVLLIDFSSFLRGKKGPVIFTFPPRNWKHLRNLNDDAKLYG